MLKILLNECLIDFSINTETPILIKSGMERVEDPDMFPVMTFRNGDEEVFIPGSSLKGVMRSHAEKITRTLRQGKEPACCNPFEKDTKDCACSHYFEKYKKLKKGEGAKKLDAVNVYQMSCLICKLFGSTESASRLLIRDAYLKNGSNAKTEKRSGVGIDRFTGGASSGALFELEVVRSSVEFEAQIYIRNFELWQLGLLAYVFKDFEDGFVSVGYGKSRGFGKVIGRVNRVELRYLGKNKPSVPNIRGIRKLVEANEYGFYDEEDKDFDVAGLTNSNGDEFGLRRIYTFADDTQIRSLWNAVVPIWNKRVDDYQWERGS
jgi:CRISPR-associated RAMP protein (TIGR02581 family)